MSDKALAIIPRNITEVQTLSELISASSLLPDALRGKLPDVIVSILAGAELGMPPMASIRGVHVVSGKPVLAAETMMGIVLGSGLAEYFTQVDSSATSVTFETKRKGSPVPQRCTWTIDDAKRAGIYKNTWLAYPRQMLAARAKAELWRGRERSHRQSRISHRLLRTSWPIASPISSTPRSSPKVSPTLSPASSPLSRSTRSRAWRSPSRRSN